MFSWNAGNRVISPANWNDLDLYRPLSFSPRYLDEVGLSGESAAEFLALYKRLVNSDRGTPGADQWKYYLAIKGVLIKIANLITAVSTSHFFLRGPIRSDDQPPVPHVAPIFSIYRESRVIRSMLSSIQFILRVATVGCVMSSTSSLPTHVPHITHFSSSHPPSLIVCPRKESWRHTTYPRSCLVVLSSWLVKSEGKSSVMLIRSFFRQLSLVIGTVALESILRLEPLYLTNHELFWSSGPHGHFKLVKLAAILIVYLKSGDMSISC